MPTATQATRLKLRFALWDKNHDGGITRADYETEAMRTVRALGESPDSPAGRRVVDSYVGVWDHIAPKAGIPVDGSMNVAQFTAVVEQEILAPGGRDFAAVLRSTIRSIVDLCDADRDGLVNREEFHRWGRAIGLSEEDRQRAFDAIDADHDDHLGVDELVDAIRDYHLGRSDVPLLGR